MLSCSFCKKTEDQIEKLVAGQDVYICNECVVIAVREMWGKPNFLKRLWRRLTALVTHRINDEVDAHPVSLS